MAPSPTTTFLIPSLLRLSIIMSSQPPIPESLGDTIATLVDPPVSTYLTSFVQPGAYTHLTYQPNPSKWAGAPSGGGLWRRRGDKATYALLPIFGQIRRADVGPLFSMEGAAPERVRTLVIERTIMLTHPLTFSLTI